MRDPSAVIRYPNELLQAHHPWVWLNEPQHAAAFTALMSLIAAIFTGIAAYGAIRAYRAALQQGREAHEQTELAKTEADRQKHVFEVQMRMAEATLKEQIRPLLVARDDWPENATLDTLGPSLLIVNEGHGAGTSVTIQPYADGDEGDLDYDDPFALVKSILPAGGHITIAGYDFTDSFAIYYASIAGHRYSTILERIDGKLNVVAHEDDPIHWPWLPDGNPNYR